MKTKMVALFLLAIMALGATGLAAAWWTDKLTITGTVTTGTFGWEWSLKGITISNDPKKIITANAELSKEDHPKTLTITATDVYPCTDLELTFDLHFWGTVPGHLIGITATGTLTLADGTVKPLTDIPPWADLSCEVIDIDSTLSAKTGINTGSIEIKDLISKLIGSQWHQCYHIDLVLKVHWVEEGMTYHNGTPVPNGIDVPQGATLKFDVTVDGKQYNAP